MALPLPKVVADAEPGGGILAASNAVNKYRVGQSAADYAPYTNYANALSKTAYAQTAPAMAIAQMLSGPGAANMDPKIYAELVNQQNNSLRNMNTSIIPHPNARGWNGTGNMLNALLQKIIPQQKGQNSLNNNPGSAQQGSQGQAGSGVLIPEANAPKGFTPMNQLPPGQENKIDDEGNSIPAGITPRNQLFGGGNFSKQASNAAVPGSAGGVNATSGAKAIQGGLEAGVKKEAENEEARMDSMINEDNANVKNSPLIVAALKKAKDARERMNFLQSGPIGGNLPGFTTAANDYDSGMGVLVAQMAKADSQGNLTNEGRELAASSKSPRAFTDEAFYHMYEYNAGLQKRNLEKPVFNNMFKNAGYNSRDIPLLWNYYQTKKPFYDSKTHKQDNNNINSWEDFYSNPKNIKAAFSPNAQKEIEKFMGSKNSNSINNKKIVIPTGKKHVRNKETGAAGFIPANRLEAYQANGYEEV